MRVKEPKVAELVRRCWKSTKQGKLGAEYSFRVGIKEIAESCGTLGNRKKRAREEARKDDIDCRTSGR